MLFVAVLSLSDIDPWFAFAAALVALGMNLGALVHITRENSKRLNENSDKVDDVVVRLESLVSKMDANERVHEEKLQRIVDKIDVAVGRVEKVEMAQQRDTERKLRETYDRIPTRGGEH